ncbi:MAG: hypothetical protein LBQ75_09475 [Zoogloeaceae bacterium]|nr:hypothetical protein [Zoogloeaceae bacterium]
MLSAETLLADSLEAIREFGEEAMLCIEIPQRQWYYSRRRDRIFLGVPGIVRGATKSAVIVAFPARHIKNTAEFILQMRNQAGSP